MASNLVVKPRRPRITLWLANENFDAKQFLCNVTNFSSNFGLNQIPMAEVGIPHGNETKTDVPNAIINELDDLVFKKAPMCVLLYWDPEPQHHTASNTLYGRQKDPKFEWPEDSVYLFKGYAAALSLNKNPSTIHTSLFIQHWLCDLSAISPYCPRLHTSNPAAFGIDFTSLKAPGEAALDMRSWSPTRNIITNATTTIRSGIWPILSAMFLSIANHSVNLNQSAVGSIDKMYVDKLKRALTRLKAFIPWHENIRKDINNISNIIINAIGSQMATTWYNTTIWDALIHSYGGMFMFAVSPAVNEARIIPAPNGIAQDHIHLTEDEIFTLSMSIPTAPVLGGCALAFRNGSLNEYGNPSFNLSYIWPPVDVNVKTLIDSVGGPIIITTLPEWLYSDNVVETTLNDIRNILTIRSEFRVKPETSVAEAKKLSERGSVNVIAQEYVKFDYLSKVFADRRVSLALPFRMDISPGACVHLKVSPVVMKEEDPINLYGVVTGVDINIDVNGGAHTNITLANVRTEKEFNSAVYNGGPVFYDEIWSGVNQPIYHIAPK